MVFASMSIGASRVSSPSRVVEWTKSTASKPDAARSKRRRTSLRFSCELSSVGFIARTRRLSLYVITLYRRIPRLRGWHDMRDGQDNSAMQCRPVMQRVANFLSGAARNIDVALMPKHCVFCGMSAPPDEASICSGCYADLPRVEYSCGRCASPVSTNLPEGIHCAACEASPPPFV